MAGKLKSIEIVKDVQMTYTKKVNRNQFIQREKGHETI